MSTADEVITEEQYAAETLGLERWVQFAFIAGTLVAFWLFDNFLQGFIEWVAIKSNIAAVNPTWITAGSAILAILAMAGLYRNPKVYTFSTEVAHELANVVWPTRQETYANTIVVLIVSVIAAIIIGAFDAVWSAVTDTIY